jgi:hypothetical protein
VKDKVVGLTLTQEASLKELKRSAKNGLQRTSPRHSGGDKSVAKSAFRSLAAI